MAVLGVFGSLRRIWTVDFALAIAVAIITITAIAAIISIIATAKIFIGAGGSDIVQTESREVGERKRRKMETVTDDGKIL